MNISLLSIRYSLAGALFLCLLFLSGCSQTGQKENILEVKIHPTDDYSLQTYLTTVPADEIKPAGNKAADPVDPYDLIIPGRATTSAEFVPGTPVEISLEGASLFVPAEVLKEKRKLSVTGLLNEDLPPLPDEISNVTRGYYPGFRFLPHGTLFDSIVSVAIAYDENLIPAGYTTDDIYTFYFDEKEEKWKALDRDSVDSKSGMIYSATCHFTDMINGIIRIPESPQTEGFVPTYMKDIKAADPAAGITFIEPPSANNEGNAALSYPIRVPQGRLGLQPQVSLQYNSDMVSGWTGFGWDLEIPSVSVDPTWGVPRYLADRESETYIFGSSQLTPVAHRDDYAARTPEKRFYSRVEANYSKIIRHGNNPANYWWEITQKDGVINYFGGLPGTGVIANAVAVNAEGRIGYWALVETRDLANSFISYKYDKPAESGQQIYISEITYTGYGAEEGPYKITFLRSDEGNTYERKDSRINARFGYIERDNQLLRRINITFNNEPVRSYILSYEDGAFMKSLLKRISELNSAGIEFYSHKFNYYNDIQQNYKYLPYGPEKKWKVPDDDLGSLLLNPINFFFEGVSAIRGSKSFGGSGSISATVGLFDGNLSTKDMTAGGNANFQTSESEGFLTLTDLNGDGLPDKVYKKGSRIYYRPNLLSDQNETMFGEEKLIDGISNFSYSKTLGFGGGIEANPYKLFFGSDISSSTTKTSIYFNDFNGDGLVDLANNGVVYFNHLENGIPFFSTSSSETPNPLYSNSDIDPGMLPDPAQEKALLEAQFPLHDAVRMWQAPFTGTITVNAPVQLVEDMSDVARSYKYKDGVKVSFQHNNNSPLWSMDIDSGDYTLYPGPPLNQISVTRGDRFFFRVQSKSNGAYDKVYWDPLIEYSVINNSDTLVDLDDSNRKIVSRFKASEDFILSGKQSVGLPRDGRIRIRGSLSKPATSDSLELVINYTDSSGVSSDIFHTVYDCPINNSAVDTSFEVIREGFLQFRIISTTSVDWSRITFSPVIEYIRIDNDNMPLTDSEGNPILSFKAMPEFATMYNDPVRQEMPVVADSTFIASYRLDTIGTGIYRMKVAPLISKIISGDTLGFIMSVKKREIILGEAEYKYLNGVPLTGDTVLADVNQGDTLFFEYCVSDIGYMTPADTAYIMIVTDTVNKVLASVFSPIRHKDEIFGPLYRGWGQFDYKGDSARATLPIDTNLLHLNYNKNINVAEIKDTSALGGIQNPLGEVFNIMIPFASLGSYIGTDDEIFVSAEHISSSRLGEKNVEVEPIVVPPSGLFAATKILKSSTISVGGGLSAVSASRSWGKENLTLDIMDMNGDRYPDLLSTNFIQYSDVKGVVSGASVNHQLGDHYSEAVAWGISGGGSFANPKCSNSLTQVPSKGIKVIFGDNFKTNNNAREAQETSKTSFTLSGSFAENDDHNDQTWLDINGDGLLDKVFDNGQVRLNLGYSFAPTEVWNFNAISVGKSLDLLGGIGVSISNRSIVAGTGLSKTFNYATETFLDVNSDGLPDMVKGKNVYFNTGSGFSLPVEWPGLDINWPGRSVPGGWGDSVPLEAGESIGESISAGFTIGIAIPIFFIKICINPGGSVNHGLSRTLTQLSDINGDGMADYVSSFREDSLIVRPSTIFRTNLLRQVERPLGGNFTVDYKYTKATYEHPGGKLALGSVKVFDGLTGDGVDTTYSTFDYEGGNYDRHERLFYGFESVRTDIRNAADNNIIHRTLIQEFHNRDYYRKGKMASEILTDGQGRKQKGLRNIYSLRDIHTGDSLTGNFALSDREPAFVALDETKQDYYSGASQPLLTTRLTYEYDTLGNISGFTDYSSGNDNDRYSVAIQYHHVDDKYIYSIPSLQEVSTADGLKRKNETVINEYGDIIRISKYITGDQTARFDLEYDEFGNLKKITRPSNYKGERMWFEYVYDPVVHSYVTGITDAYGYTSSTNYDYKWGMPVEATDMNSQKTVYTFDDYGRMKTVTGPHELASGKPYTIAFDYFPDADIPYAHTMQYDSVQDSNIDTYTFCDGLSRKVQVKKTSLLFEDASSEDKPGYVVSGKILYNAFGFPASNYQPTFEPEGNPAEYNSTVDNVQPASIEYDVADRIRKLVLPDGSVTTHSYSVGSYNGETVLVDSLTDALGNKSVTYSRADGKKAATVRSSTAGDIITSYDYNGVGELITITDPLGNKITEEYDMLGRRISFNHPDAGLTEFKYDGAGNIIEKITASLRKQIPEGGAITYKYDHERLTEVVYPRNIQNRVNYKYGEPGAPFNRAGRVVLQQDASGGQEFFYGRLGDVIKTIRTVQLGESDMRTWIWSAEYDSWNRVKSMTYPDGEEVTYSYNRAGDLVKMDGKKLGQLYSYISRIGYNRYKKQVYLKYGNGSETKYGFESRLQRLTQMNVSSSGKSILANEYTYDLLGNVLGISNNSDPGGDIGGTISHTYSYDELYRLTGASGEFKGKNTSGTYNLSMEYDNIGKILHKVQEHKVKDQSQIATSYDLVYKYNGPQPGTPTEIGDRTFAYDANGNLNSWQDTVTNDYRQLAWDEENRLTMISDNGYVSRYVYDASGNRVIKSHGGTQGVYIDGAPVGVVNTSADNYTVYLSPFFVFQNERFTKHYYNGQARVCSKTGNGQYMNQYRPGVFEITAGKENYIKRQQKLLTAKQEFEERENTPPGPPTIKGIYTDPLFSGIAFPDPGTPESGAPGGWPRQPVFAPEGGPPGAPVKWSDEITNDNVTAGFGFVGNGNFEEGLRYFYHSDHLGSVSYITNSGGEPTQFISYLPYGEIFAEQHSSWDSPYKFNARELDSETGLYYYGARYYEPKTSLWISPDPLAEEIPGWTPYNFCFGNPVFYVDFNGKLPGDFFTTMEEAARDWGIIYNPQSISLNKELGSSIYRTTNATGATGYSYSAPDRGEDAAVTVSDAPAGKTVVADIHSHGAYSYEVFDDDVFSGIGGTPRANKDSRKDDLGGNNSLRIVGFLTTPSGTLQKYDPETGVISLLSDDMPSDIHDPARKRHRVASAAPSMKSTPSVRRPLPSPVKSSSKKDKKPAKE